MTSNFMHRFFFIPLVVLIFAFLITPSKIFAATTKVGLGTAGNFAVLGGSAVNDTTSSVVTGDVGLSPAAWPDPPVLTCGEVTGTIYSVDAAGPLSCRITDGGLLTIAKNDLTTAYNDAAGRSITSTIGTELAGAVLTDGVYNSESGTFEIAAAGTLTLDGNGNADSVFIFKMEKTLTTFSGSKVALTNGAQACNVFWQVGSSAVLGTGTNFVGDIMADQSITDDSGSTVNGRFLARIAAVTLNNTNITKATCTAAVSSTSSSSTLSTTSNQPAASYCPPISDQVVSPIIIESKRVDANSVFIGWGPYSGTDKFIVQYGFENGKWLYNVNVTGFSTTIKDLLSNRPVWIQVAARNDCTIGSYGETKLVGQTGVVNPNVLGVKLPNTGIGPKENISLSLVISGSIFVILSFYLLIRGKNSF